MWGGENFFLLPHSLGARLCDARLDRESGVSAVGGRVVRVTRLLSLSVNRISKLTLSSMAMLMMSCAQ